MIMAEPFKGYQISHLLPKRSWDLFTAHANMRRRELWDKIFWNMQKQMREHSSWRKTALTLGMKWDV